MRSMLGFPRIFLNLNTLGFILLLGLHSRSMELIPRFYECDVHRRCVPSLTRSENSTSLSVCKLSCSANIALWPMPKKLDFVEQERLFTSFNVSLVSMELEGETDSQVVEWLEAALDEQLEWLRLKNVNNQVMDSNKRGMLIRVRLNNSHLKLTRATSEHYRVVIGGELDDANDMIEVHVTATNYFGARHALETLFQLVDYDELELKSFFVLSHLVIDDEPRYAHRGLSLDTARNFIGVETIKSIVDGMAHSKLNVLHWHMTDSNAFPVQLMSQPVDQMVMYGAQDAHSFYSIEDIVEIERHATRRGVRVVPEIDQPAHVGLGWEGPDFENFTVCVEKEPWFDFCVQPPCGQLNPGEKGVLRALQLIYDDLERLLHFDSFHLGGDEVNLDCWASSQLVTDYMLNQSLSIDEQGFMELWAEFTVESHRRLLHSVPDVEAILWGSRLTSPQYLHLINNDDFVIQPWQPLDSEAGKEELRNLIEKGFRVILSSADRLYLDCGRENWVQMAPNWCSPHNGWREIYYSDPTEMLKQAGVELDDLDTHLVVGAEVAVWTEYIDSNTLVSMVFPRASALGERLWSKPETTSPLPSPSYSETLMSTTDRLSEHRWRLTHRGVQAAPLHPEYCRQRPGFCYQMDDSPIVAEEIEQNNDASVINNVHIVLATVATLNMFLNIVH